MISRGAGHKAASTIPLSTAAVLRRFFDVYPSPDGKSARPIRTPSPHFILAVAVILGLVGVGVALNFWLGLGK